jgi:hypothetical protein
MVFVPENRDRIAILACRNEARRKGLRDVGIDDVSPRRPTIPGGRHAPEAIHMIGGNQLDAWGDCPQIKI